MKSNQIFLRVKLLLKMVQIYLLFLLLLVKALFLRVKMREEASDLSTVIASGTIHSRGQVILFHSSFSPVNSWVELNEHLLIAAFCRRDITFRIACIYAPNRIPERDGFFISCLDFVDMSVPTILGGDFNGSLTELKIVEALACLLLFATASFL